MSDFWLGVVALPAGTLALALAVGACVLAYQAAYWFVGKVAIRRLGPAVNIDHPDEDYQPSAKRLWAASRVLVDPKILAFHALFVTVTISFSPGRKSSGACIKMQDFLKGAIWSRHYNKQKRKEA